MAGIAHLYFECIHPFEDGNGRMGRAIAEKALARGRQRLVRYGEQARLFSRIDSALNDRQRKALMRMFREKPEGFKGGMSAGNYQTITGAASATATRDLGALVELDALRRTGKGKGTRYWLNLFDLDKLPQRPQFRSGGGTSSAPSTT